MVDNVKQKSKPERDDAMEDGGECQMCRSFGRSLQHEKERSITTLIKIIDQYGGLNNSSLCVAFIKL